MASTLRDGLGRTKAAICGLGLLGYAFLVKASGGSLWELLLFLLCAAAYLYLPGRFFAKVSGLEARFSPHLLAILYGTGFFAALICFCVRLHCLWLARVLPSVLGGLWFLSAQRERPRKPDGAALCRLALYGGLVFLFGMMVTVKNARPAAVGAIVPSQDVLWNIGNAASFSLGFPPQDIRFSGVRLAYHYLTELVAGGLSLVSGISCWNILTMYAGPLFLAALLCAVFALGRSFYEGDQNKALLFTGSLFAFNCASLWTALLNGTGSFGNTNLLHLITNVNAQSTALIFISIFAVLFFDLARRRFDAGAVEILTFLGATVLVSFAKGPAAAIVLCSFAITMLFCLARRPKWGRALLCMAGALGLFAAVYFGVFAAGANNSVHLGYKTIEATKAYALFAPVRGYNQITWWVCVVLACVLHVFLMQPFQFPLYCKGLWGDVRRLWRLDPARLFANGVVAGGFLAFFLFWHPSYSQLYFALIAIFFLNLLAVDQVGRLKTRAGKWLVRACGAVALATTLVLVVNFTGSGARQLGRNLDVIEKYPYVSTATAQDEAAMQWLRANTPPDAVFATNRIHSMANAADGISSLYTALSGRQAYMEGYTYAITNMGVSEDVVAAKQAVNAALFHAATPPEEVARLCRENGIGYLVYSAQYPGNTEQLSALELAFGNEQVQIYTLRE